MRHASPSAANLPTAAVLYLVNRNFGDLRHLFWIMQALSEENYYEFLCRCIVTVAASEVIFVCSIRIFWGGINYRFTDHNLEWKIASIGPICTANGY
jgi:hypothetical protein